MHSYRTLIVFLHFVVEFKEIYAIVGGQRAKVPPYDDPVVFVNHIGRYSRVEGYFNPITQLYTFRGIRYADPPTRENRFLRPRLKRLVGDVDARRNAPPCPQPDYYDERKIIGNEDCLALNIFTPQMPDETTGLPVILWIHGGGYRYGSAAQYGAEPLIQNKIVFVPIQYRLGTLGILGDGSKEFGGNVAMFDMHAALQFITEYISFFGGDKNRIKVMGHGSGASSAMFLSTSPMGRSSIDGVISMSGSSLNQYAYDENAKNSTEEIGSVHNCPYGNEIELVKCLRSKSIEEIIEKDSVLQIERLQERNLIKAMSGMASFSPNIESKDDDRGLPGIIVENPNDSLKKEPKFKIPLLIGTTKHETGNAIDQKEIVKIFNSVTDFLKASAKTLKFNEILNATKQVTGIIDVLKLPALNDYLTIPTNLSPEKVLQKLIETTTDMFFNIPCVLTATLWTKYSSAFFYQFEHIGEASPSGKYFLKPLPIVSKNNSKGLVAHGDELGYLFDVYDVFGNRINETELKSPRDQEARANFIKLVLKFAYINASLSNQLTFDDQILQAFQADSTSFVKITDKISFDKDFRFCQLSVFGTPLKVTKKISCEFLMEGLKKINLIPKANEIISGGGKKLGFL